MRTIRKRPAYGKSRRRKAGVATAVPALTAGGKAATLGGSGAADSYGTKKALDAASRTAAKRQLKYKNKRTRSVR